MPLTRRQFAVIATAALLPPGPASADQIWSVLQAHEAMKSGTLQLIDIRSREEWNETGVAEGAWPISLHEADFSTRLFAAKSLAGDRTIALICATGGRTGYVMDALRKANQVDFLDISEGMLGSRRGPGWIAAGLPVVSLNEALSTLPASLK